MLFVSLLLIGSMVLTRFSAPQAQQESSRPDPSSYVGRAFVFDADLGFARAAGWVGEQETDEEILARARKALETRVRRAAAFTEAQVLAEDGHRLVVVFVGRQDAGMESFLREGLACAGRLELRTVARESDLGGALQEEERRRFAVWREAHPSDPIVAFDAVDREAGGPAAGIHWRVPRGSDDPAEALPLLAEDSLQVVREDMERGLLTAKPGETKPPRYHLECELIAQARARVASLRTQSEGRTIVVCLDERVLGPLEPIDGGAGSTESPGTLALPGTFSVAETRVLIFAIAGETLPLPLHFVEFSKRRLDGVVQEGS